MKNSQPLIGVVTPVYNEERYLAECIESVLQQTYQNWEYTIIDNCSTDASGEIARQYAARDSRIKVKRTERLLDALANHNFALRQISAQCRYCKVVLGDDWIFPECLERMVAVAEAHPSIGIVGAYAQEGTQVRWTGLPYSSGIISGREACRKHFLERLHVFGTATSVLYRADLVRALDPFYNEDNVHADTEVCFALLEEADFGFVHQVLAFSRLREASRNTASSDIQAHFPAMLHTLQTYGLKYLSKQEQRACIDSLLNEYYDFLGKNLLKGRNRDFWVYHRQKLLNSGVGFSSFRVAKGLAKTALRCAFRPAESIAAARKYFRKKERRDRIKGHDALPLRCTEGEDVG